MYARRLGKSEYEELMRKTSMEDIFNYLKGVDGYSKVFNSHAHVTSRGELEVLYDEVLMTRLAQLIRYVSVKELPFFRVALMTIEERAILNKITSLNTGAPYTMAKVPRDIKKHGHIDFDQLEKVTSYEELVDTMTDTPYELVLRLYTNAHGWDNVSKINRDLKRLYYETYINIATTKYRGQTRKDLLQIIETLIELDNICRIYRLKKFFNVSPDDIRQVLYLDYSRIPLKKMDELINAKDAETFLTMLADSEYKLYLDPKEFVFIEYYAEGIKYNLAKRFMRYSTQPAVVYMTYVILQTIELANLKHITEGVRYLESQDKIEQLLIY